MVHCHFMTDKYLKVPNFGMGPMAPFMAKIFQRKVTFQKRKQYVVKDFDTSHLLCVPGARPIGSFMSDPDAASFGCLDAVEHVVLEKKSYIHMTCTSSNVVTLLLCGSFEQPTENLKVEKIRSEMRKQQFIPGS